MKHFENETGGYFSIERGGQEEGRMSYIAMDQVMVINHTRVSPASQGSGLGTQLVKGAVDYAREKGCMLRATCPFARAVLGKHPDWQDVVAK